MGILVMMHFVELAGVIPQGLQVLGVRDRDTGYVCYPLTNLQHDRILLANLDIAPRSAARSHRSDPMPIASVAGSERAFEIVPPFLDDRSYLNLSQKIINEDNPRPLRGL